MTEARVELYSAEEANEIRDRVAEALRRARDGLIRPLWADMTEGQKNSWRIVADDFISVAHQCGIYFQKGPRQ